MFDYLQQFNNLPKELRDKVSSPEVMAIIADLEKKYQVDLASLIMKVMVKSLSLKSLPAYFVSDWQLGQNSSEKLAQELTEKVFSLAANHLGLAAPAPSTSANQNIEDIVKAVGIVLPSSDLLNRFKTIIATYLRGVRSRVATRDALAKAINFGGLNLSEVEINRIFSICDKQNLTSPTNSDHSGALLTTPLGKAILPAAGGLDKIISAAEMHSRSGSEYNLRQAIASGQIKRPESVAKEDVKIKTLEAPDKVEAIEAPDKIGSIEAPDKVINLPLQKPQIPQSQNVTPPIIPAAQKLAPTPVIMKSSAPAPAPVVAKSSVSTPAPAQATVKILAPTPAPVKSPIPTPASVKSPIPTLTKSPSPAPIIPGVASVVAPKKPLSLMQKIKALFAGQKKVAKPEKTVNPIQVSHLAKPTPAPQPIKPTQPTPVPQPIKPTSVPVPTQTPIKPTPTPQPIKPTPAPQPTQPIKPTPTPTPAPVRPQAVAAARPAANPMATSSRPSMHDVKPMTRVMGPIEELQFLDLVNFRRLGKTPDEISAKIFNKIKLLEVDGYDKMIAGVRAWRQSPVNRLYLKMMKEAVSKGMTIKDLAASVQGSQDKYLKLEEIEEILKMNSKLAF